MEEALAGALANLPMRASVQTIVRDIPRAQLTEELAGTTVRSSTAWRSASRNIQRWAKGGGISPRLRSILYAERLRFDPPSVTVEASGEVYGRERDFRGIHVLSHRMRPVVSSWADGDTLRAADLFETAFWDAYGMPSGLFFNNVSDLTLRPD